MDGRGWQVVVEEEPLYFGCWKRYVLQSYAVCQSKLQRFHNVKLSKRSSLCLLYRVFVSLELVCRKIETKD